MDDKLSPDTIAIVASNLTAALCAAGGVKLGGGDDVGTVLHHYWQFAAELGNANHRASGDRE
ncbi:hypothetical protein [uncultured Sphingomonas sp.]|uniref:hypothetical protein n=1 Tax=uncultured Sphingomonas sp. TaxID=158754 RepID=UPI0025D8687F|nr:hypothetical protein [uncultured Sphingomonas sp.]